MDAKSMWALRYHGRPELVLEQVPLPEPSTGEVRIRPLAVGIDGTDAHILAGEFPTKPPMVPGHEIAGFVEKLGSEVRRLKEGELVCVEPHKYCGCCRYCRMGREHLCVEKKAYGVHLDGGLAEAVVVPERVVYKVPQNIPPEIACLAEPLGCCIHAMDRLEPKSGLSLLIYGAGTAGCILILLGKLAGLAPIVAIEPQEDRREMALNFGADAVFHPSSDGWKEQAIRMTDGAGFDFIIDAVGSGPILEDALTFTARGARLMVFGVPVPDAVARVNPYLIFREELSIIGSVINPYTHQRAVDLLPFLGLERLTISRYPLDEYRAAYRELGRGNKVVISPQEISRIIGKEVSGRD